MGGTHAPTFTYTATQGYLLYMSAFQVRSSLFSDLKKKKGRGGGKGDNNWEFRQALNFSDSSFHTTICAKGIQKYELLMVSIVSIATLNTQLSRAAGIKPFSTCQIPHKSAHV